MEQFFIYSVTPQTPAAPKDGQEPGTQSRSRTWVMVPTTGASPAASQVHSYYRKLELKQSQEFSLGTRTLEAGIPKCLLTAMPQICQNCSLLSEVQNICYGLLGFYIKSSETTYSYQVQQGKSKQAVRKKGGKRNTEHAIKQKASTTLYISTHTCSRVRL